MIVINASMPKSSTTLLLQASNHRDSGISAVSAKLAAQRQVAWSFNKSTTQRWRNELDDAEKPNESRKVRRHIQRIGHDI